VPSRPLGHRSSFHDHPGLSQLLQASDFSLAWPAVNGIGAAPTARSNTRAARPDAAVQLADTGGRRSKWATPDLAEYPEARGGPGHEATAMLYAEHHARLGLPFERTARRLPLLRCREGRAAVARAASGWTRERMQICSPPGRRRCTWWPTWRRLRYGRDVPRRAVRLECRLPASASAHGRPAHGQSTVRPLACPPRQRQPVA
jgi:hypothetical protein